MTANYGTLTSRAEKGALSKLAARLRAESTWADTPTPASRERLAASLVEGGTLRQTKQSLCPRYHAPPAFQSHSFSQSIRILAVKPGHLPGHPGVAPSHLHVVRDGTHC